VSYKGGIFLRNVRFGSKADILVVSHHVRFTPKADIARHIRDVSPGVSLVSLSWLKALGTEHRSRNWSGEELDKRFRHLWHFGVSANPSGEECRAGELPRKRAKNSSSLSLWKRSFCASPSASSTPSVVQDLY
jgi:hypothetical protein